MLVQLGGIVTYTAVDGARKKKTTTLAAAQKFAHEMIGHTRPSGPTTR